LIISNNIRSIGKYSFYNNKLSSFIIPSSVNSIGDFAFDNNYLQEINIPDNITSMSTLTEEEKNELIDAGYNAIKEYIEKLI
jgi:hypothetical protein